VLLLALAVAASTVAWCLAGSAERSTLDQADHSVGADLRLAETGAVTAPGRAARLAELPGVRAVLPAARSELQSGTGKPAELIALDATAAAGVVRIRPDLADGDAAGLFRALAGRRVTAPVIDLPAGARRLTGSLTGGRAETVAVFTGTAGDALRVPLGNSGRFSVDLPASTAPLRLAGFLVTARGTPADQVQWRLAGLATESGPLSLAGGDWRSVGRSTVAVDAEVQGTALGSTVQIGANGEAPFAVVQRAGPGPVPVLATPQAMTALQLKVGARSPLRLAGSDIFVQVVGTVTALPGTREPAAILADLPSLTTTLLAGEGLVRAPQEWWIATTAGTGAETATAAGRLPGLQVFDRTAAAATFAGGAYGEGARIALFAAALGAILLAAVGITVDVRTTARRRITELAVLHTLGAGSRLLARSIMVEQAFLAGMGVLVGLVVGLGVAATMAPLLILTPTAGRPVPPPLLEFDWPLVAGTAALLLVLALGLSALVGTTLRRRLAVAQLRIGADR
jgi:hypothetical protein